jgi:hypothetical protein
MSDLLTTAEAAAILTERGYTDRSGGAVKPRTVLKWCEQGRLPSRIIGTGNRITRLIERAAIDAFTPPQQGRPRKEQPE